MLSRRELPFGVAEVLRQRFGRDADLDRRAAVSLRCGGGLLPVAERLRETAQSSHHPVLKFPSRAQHWDQMPVGVASLPYRIPREIRRVEGKSLDLAGVPYILSVVRDLAALRRNRREMGNCTYDSRAAYAAGNEILLRMTALGEVPDDYRLLNVSIRPASYFANPIWRVVEAEGMRNAELGPSVRSAIDRFVRSIGSESTESS
jgi:hypothetical protein